MRRATVERHHGLKRDFRPIASAQSLDVWTVELELPGEIVGRVGTEAAPDAVKEKDDLFGKRARLDVWAAGGQGVIHRRLGWAHLGGHEHGWHEFAPGIGHGVIGLRKVQQALQLCGCRYSCSPRARSRNQRATSKLDSISAGIFLPLLE